MHLPPRLLGLVASALSILPSSPGQTAYLPAPGELTLTPLYSYQRARDFYFLGDTRATLPDPLEQHTTRLDLDDSPAPDWGFDASFGWSTVS